MCSHWPVYSTMAISLLACADAYLTPCIREYIKGFSSGFKNVVRDSLTFLHQSEFSVGVLINCALVRNENIMISPEASKTNFSSNFILSSTSRF